MQRVTRWVLALSLMGVLTTVPLQAAPPGGKDSEASLTAKLERENNPVKKALIEIRLSRLKLRAATAANDKGEIESALDLLRAYRRHIENAWEFLRNSRRVAHKKSQGFKELEIAIREDQRFLEDMKRSLPLENRAPVEDITGAVSRIRAEDIKALFPTMAGAER